MAINPTNEFVGKIASDPTNYPYGKAKNVTSTGDGTGTPWVASLLNDIFGFQQSLLKAAGITPSGTPDKFGTSEYLQSVIALASGRAMRYDDTGAVNAVVLTPRTDQQSVANLFDGLTVQFTPVITNTGAVTLNYNSTGILNLKNIQGDDIDVGFLDPNIIYTVTYHTTAGEWRLNILSEIWKYVNTPVIVGSNNAETMRIGFSASGAEVLSVGKNSIKDWGGAYSAIQIGGNFSIFQDQAVGAGKVARLIQNAYLDGSSNWRYISTDEASYVQQSGGGHRWFTAASGTAESIVAWTEVMRTDTNGLLQVGKIDSDAATKGHMFFSNGRTYHTASGFEPLTLNRLTNDGKLLSFQQSGSEEGSISVSGTTVSYNSFCGGHWSQLTTNTTDETFTKGMVVETIDEMCEWIDKNGNQEDNDQLVRFKKSDVVGSKRVYGIFSNWDMDDDYNDAIIHAIGATQILVTGACVGGDLLESNGDGTAKVQADDIIRSSTIGKVTKSDNDETVTLVPCVLYCG